MSFLYTSLLTIGLPLVAVPVLIHLINLRRQRRIEWAAMDFLLQSEKKHRKWILLKQLILLLMRMAAIAAITFMVAQPVLRSEWGETFGESTTHHLVLFDDSYSMTEQLGGGMAFDRAKRVVQTVADRAANEGGAQLFTMLRFSEAANLTAGSQPDLFRERIDASFDEELESLLASMRPSETASGPSDALTALARLPKGDEGETLVVYMITDFRKRNWERATELRELLLQAQAEIDMLHFIQCADTSRGNLAITSLRPASGVLAAGVESWMEVTVANYDDAPADSIAVELEEDGHPRAALELDPIPPRESVTHRFRVNFPTAGPHFLSARLPDDAVAVDNRRFFATEVPIDLPVLLVVGSESSDDGRFIRNALAPGGAVKTGWRPTIESVTALRDADRLARYAAIFLLDVPRIDPADVTSLEAYAAAGGGVACFVGERTDRTAVNQQWWRDGVGFFPVPLRLPTQNQTDHESGVADMRVIDHTVFRVFAGERNSFLGQMMVDFYYALDDAAMGMTESSPDAGPAVIASLRGGAPLVIEKRFGEGRVVAFLTKASPEETSLGRWNNWGNNPAFPVVVNELTALLAANAREAPARTVGDPIEVTLDESEYAPNVTFNVPADKSTVAFAIDASSENGALRAVFPNTAMSGIYEALLTRRDGAEATRLFAINVPDGEGDLRIETPADLETDFDGVRFEFHSADDFSATGAEAAGFQIADSLLYFLIAALLCEQLLAFFLSYHPKPAKASA